jgi:hypothetical protein
MRPRQTFDEPDSIVLFEIDVKPAPKVLVEKGEVDADDLDRFTDDEDA